jgi:hypothetical protein
MAKKTSWIFFIYRPEFFVSGWSSNDLIVFVDVLFVSPDPERRIVLPE